MKVVCINKALHMWNYTEGKTYQTSNDLNHSFYQGLNNPKDGYIVTAIQRNKNEMTITDDRGMRMYWNSSDMKLYFIPLREHNIKQLIL